MPLNTIVVNQGDFQTNVPEGNTVQEILPSWDVRTEDENLRVIVDKQEPPCQTQPEVQVTELKPEVRPDSEFLNCTSEIIPTKSTIIADTTGKASSDRCSRAIISDSSSTQVPNISPGRSSSSDRSMEEQDMTTFSSVPVSMEVKQGVTTLSSSTTLTNDVSHGCDLGGFNVASNKGWGIPKGLGLRGGSPGLNSLNNGTSGWGPVPQPTGNAPTGWGAPASQTSSAGNPNSGVIGGNPGQVGSAGPSSAGSIGPNGASSASNSSSSPPGSGGLNNPGQALPSANNNHPGGSNQWASTSPNRNTSQNTNGQPNISGSQINNNPSGNATTQGPPGGNPMQMGNQNMGNNPNANNSMNQASLGQNPSHASGVGAGNSGVITNAGSSSWAQAAGKSLQASGTSANSSSNNMNNNAGNPIQGNPALGGNVPPTAGSASQPGSTSSSSVTSKQIEQLNSMREALFSHDGWGGQNVNQDSSWDIPSSPEPPHKDLGMGPAGATGGGTATWKLNVNNGTDLWEANLRNGGAPPPAPPTSKTPWGHTPTTNIGGTWGEEDDTPDQSNVWTAPPANNAPGPSAAAVSNNSSGNAGQMQWGMNNGPQQTPNNAGGGGMWNSAPMKKDQNDWGNSGRMDGGNRGHAGHIGADNRGVGMVGNENRPTARGWDDRNQSQLNNGPVDANQGMWNKPQPPPQQPPQQSQWGGGPGPGPVAQQHANMGMGIGGGHGAQHGLKDSIGNKQPGGSGWDDVSPPTQRRPVPNIPNYDDGTSLWGSPIAAQQQPQQPQPRGMPPNRGMPNKMDMGWGGHGGQTRNGWQAPEGPQDGGFNPGGGGGGGWNDENKAIGSWSEPQMSQNNSWNKPKTPTNPNPGWGDDGLVDVSNWGVPPKPTGSTRYHNGNANGSTAKDLLWSTKPYKLLADLGCKKEDLEQLNFRSSNINLNDAMDHLDPLAPGGVGVGGGRGPMDGPWGGGGGGGPLGPQRRGPPPPVEDHFDLGIGVGPGPMGMGPPPQPRGGFPPNPSGFSGANSIMNNVGNPGATLNQGLLARLLNSQQQNNQPQFNPQGRAPANSLQLLVQQIRMAVQAGYLSSQILSHPLPQQSLYLLNQLLQQIKVFHQLTETQRQIGKSNSNAALQLSVQITKTKQAIANLHNQIAAQQALHAKQQQQQQPHHPLAGGGGPGNPPNNDFFKGPPVLGDNRGVNNSGSSMMDPFLQGLPNNFGSDVGLKESNQHQQSKLGQWTKLPSVDKDDSNPVPEFSRAPGQQSNNSSNILKNNPSLILGQSDNSTWSSVAPRSGGDGWPTDHSSSSQNVNNSALNQGDDSSKPGSNVNMNPEAWPADLVPEFEPGKPWKGTQLIKNVDDDPTLTPGSVVRSPLSLAAIKEDFLQKNSTSTMSSMQNDPLTNPLISIQSNPWSFTPTSAGSTSIANSLAKLNPKWDDMGRRDLWDYNNSAGGAPGSRPPPGLPKKAPGPNTSVPSASGNVTSGTNSSTFNSFRNNSSNSWGGHGGGGGLGNSHSWLLLRNLTPQIDGSTLKTLCCQHGPLQKFHLYTSHGVALVKYSSSEEAGKAQRALNNCLLGNTTILAETAGEDVHNLIQGFNSAVNQQQQQQQQQQQSSAPTNSGLAVISQVDPSGHRRDRILRFSSGNSNDNPWGVIRDNSPLWSSNPWGSSGLDAPDRATPSSLNSLLPGDLLGGESA